MENQISTWGLGLASENSPAKVNTAKAEITDLQLKKDTLYAEYLTQTEKAYSDMLARFYADDADAEKIYEARMIELENLYQLHFNNLCK